MTPINNQLSTLNCFCAHENQLRPGSRRVKHYVPRNHRHDQIFGGRIAADYDSEGRLAGLEILDAQKRFGGTETMHRVELEAVGT